MNLLTWGRLLLYFATTSGAGYVFLRLFRFPYSPLVHNWATCYMAGQLVVLILTLFTVFLSGWLLPLMWLFLGVSALVSLLPAKTADPRRGNAISSVARQAGMALLWTVGALAVFPDVAILVQQVPLYESDARSCWFFHGKALYLAGGVDPSFFTNPLYAWSLPDYPLLLPSSAAWMAFCQGGWDDYSSKAFLLLNFASYACLFYVALGEKGYPWWIRAFVVVVLLDQETYSYLSGFADNHYIMPLVLFFFLLSLPEKRRHIPLLMLLVVYAANMKNEGKMYAILICAGAAAFWFARRLAGRRAAADSGAGEAGRWERWGKPAIWGLALGALPLVLWESFKNACGIANPVGIVRKLADVDRLWRLLAERAGVVSDYMIGFYDFKGAPYVIALILLLLVWRVLLHRRQSSPALRVRPHEGAALLLFAACNVFAFLAYVVTPLDLKFHLGTSAGRVLFLPYMALLLLAVYGAEALYAHAAARFQVSGGP